MVQEGIEVHLIFRLRAHRFEFRAIDSVYFPPGKAGNVVRGALGTIPIDLQAKLPSRLAEPPNPFVLRASHLDGRRFGPGDNEACTKPGSYEALLVRAPDGW